MPDLEGGTTIILILRETFRLPETQIELPHFEVEEGTASDLRPEEWSAPRAVGCRKTMWRITNLALLGAWNGRREACSHISASYRC
jgi:hypothetical protein